ncbi:hypothetical protein GCM10010123_19450 [Pilimelia anulata]|uniref:Uncharacterized protein n=1 Tax=Pilimelia anulata TaxID=53371 RepID=A0A8J3B5P6_9ACTN|nr:hypothetical protein GCM10010123_19450 [Pilimelia anulata]
MGDRVSRWRLVVTRDRGWPGPPQLTLYLDTVADLRADLRRIRANPATVRWRDRRDRTGSARNRSTRAGARTHPPCAESWRADVACCTARTAICAGSSLTHRSDPLAHRYLSRQLIGEPQAIASTK